MFSNARERCGVVRQRKQIVQKVTVMGRPGQMLGKAGRVEPADKMLETSQVVGIQIALATNGQPDAMNRDREPFRQMAQLRYRASAIPHVVLGMDFQPANRAGVGHDVGVVLRLVANAGTVRQGCQGRGVKHVQASFARS